jgi:hypothetical protein
LLQRIVNCSSKLTNNDLVVFSNVYGYNGN